MYEKIGLLAEKHCDEIIAIRRHFHKHPELSWKEIGTTQKIVELLERWGYKNLRVGLGGNATGVSVDIGNPSGKKIGLRADIDALPLNEEKNCDYASENRGIMHACGHDAHTAMLLGAAMILKDIEDRLKGSVRLIFQPAEENGPGSGGGVLVKEGVLDGLSRVFGMHVSPSLATGRVACRKGPLFAAGDLFDLVFTGRGGHGAVPEQAIDPTVAAATFILAAQTALAREVSPRDSAVMSIGKLHSSVEACNIIPEKVFLNGTVRTFLDKTQDHMEEMLERVARSSAEAYRCKADFTYTRVHPSLVNDPDAVSDVARVAEHLLGEGSYSESDLLMGSEDFSYFSRAVPGAFALLGTGNPSKRTSISWHNPLFDVDEDALPLGAALYAGFAWDFFNQG